MQKAFPHLMAPGQIGSMSVRNRIYLTPMGVNLAEEDGSCGPRNLAFYLERARGGAGMINVGGVGVSLPSGQGLKAQLGLSDDRHIAGMAKLADALHDEGTKLMVQLHHSGLKSVEDMIAGRPVSTPSLPSPPSGSIVPAFLPEEFAASPFSKIKPPQFRVMTEEDILVVIGDYTKAAVRARDAGVDAVEIHAGHGYLLSNFVSRHTNKRDDRYGGSLENRMRIVLEILASIRAKVGKEYPILCKIDADEFGYDDGVTPADACLSARMLEQAGIDGITVTTNFNGGIGKLHSGGHTPHEPAQHLPLVARIKREVSVPVLHAGRLEPEIADEAIGKRELDFAAMGRKLLADPHLPRKLAEHTPDKILPCIYCYTCVSAIYTNEPIRCAVNPETGFEHLPGEKAATPALRVVVVGGGPGGMEAARRLDALGHGVTLFEESKRLGGTLRFAGLAYEPNERLLNWLCSEIEDSRVAVHLSHRVTPQEIAALRPDAVVVATGARRDMPPVPGSDQSHVFSGDEMRGLMLGTKDPKAKTKLGLGARFVMGAGAMTGVTANLDLVRSASHHWMPFGRHVTIIGGSLVGLELAEFLVDRGRIVTVVGDEQKFGAGLALVRRLRVLDELREHGVGLFPGATDIAIGKNDVRFRNAEGEESAIPADHVIVAQGATGDLHLAEILQAHGLRVFTVGDCDGVAYIEGAIRGAKTAVSEILETVDTDRAAVVVPV